MLASSLAEELRSTPGLAGVAAFAVLVSISTAGFAQQGSAPVTIVNPLPVPVEIRGATTVSGTIATKNTEDPGRVPFAAQFDWTAATESCLIAGGNFQICSYPGGFPAVPAGRRLVITNMAGAARAPVGCKVSTIFLRTGNFGGTLANTATIYAVGHPNPAIAEEAHFNDQILGFVDAGSSPVFGVGASCPGLSSGGQLMTISGYLVTLP